MTDEKNNTPSSSGKGFGGFGDLVSDVSKDIESATRESSNTPTHQPKATVPSTSSTQHTTAQTEVPQVNKLPVSPLSPDGSSGAKWLWGIGIVMVVLIGIGNSGKEKSPSYSPSPTYSSPPTYAPVAIPVPASDMPPASVYSPVLLKEDKPPIGTNNSLSRDQLRYCLSEEIRLGAMKNTLNQYAGGEVDLFNAKVNDYNSRCGEFRYRRGSLESVRSEVEANRLTLEADGSARLVDLRGVTKQEKIPNKQAKSTQIVEQNTMARSDNGIAHSSDRENYKTCIAGDYPSLCNHNLLTDSEGVKVAAAERRERNK